MEFSPPPYCVLFISPLFLSTLSLSLHLSPSLHLGLNDSCRGTEEKEEREHEWHFQHEATGAVSSQPRQSPPSPPHWSVNGNYLVG